MKGIVLLLSVLCAQIVTAQQEDSLFIRKIADEILVHGKAYDNLRVLCKTVGPRLAGSPGMVKAEAWGQQTLKDMGATNVFLQQCMVPHWVRGGKDLAVLRYTDDKGKKQQLNLDVLALGNSLGSGPKGVTGPLVIVNSINEIEAMQDKLKGKIVFYNVPFNPSYVQTFRAYGESGGIRRAGPSRAARYGAVGVITRSLSESTDNNPHTGATQYDSTYPKIPCAAVGLRDAEQMAKVGANAEVFLKTSGYFLPDTIGHNVIAEIRGSEFPEQIITVGGHLDSWDPAEGAHDDGAGVVQSIEVLRAFMSLQYKPKHTIRIVLFANEENGTRGGNEYANQAKQKGEKHIFAMESDEGGFTPRAIGIAGTATQMEKARQWLPLLQPYGIGEISTGGGGTDIGPLRVLNTTLSSYVPDSQRYFDFHHARNDVFENVNKRELELGAVNMTAFIYLVDKYGL